MHIDKLVTPFRYFFFFPYFWRQYKRGFKLCLIFNVSETFLFLDYFTLNNINAI